MPAGNFDDTLNVGVNGNGAVIATGPLSDGVVTVHVMCAWVVQRTGVQDAVANNMGAPDGPEGLTVARDDKGKLQWNFPLSQRLGSTDFINGWGTAMAIGVFEDADNNKRSFYWAETVQLDLVAGGIPAAGGGGM